MDALSSALAGFQSATDRIDRAAGRVASTAAFSANEPGVPVDVVDIASELVGLASARIDAAANIKVLKVANEVQKQTLDLFV